jgi:hypothetical protein
MDEIGLTKGQIRKLNYLRRSLGNNIADQAFSKWLKTQKLQKPATIFDPIAENIKTALQHLQDDKSINFGRFGYIIKRAKGRSAKGLSVTRIEK